ncbi:hybrid sensor histidine kinase/response regulator [Asaia sp. W19]|uniref:response regulator n=1 Tax=unclassified Asaia TaxID=2685023 RepID=UPI000F8CEE14|nr:response regulator [Asaia sp. W19]RUT27008.1 hybrid sensor histidine kinase/response regulator [Asaia sp. W19]
MTSSVTIPDMHLPRILLVEESDSQAEALVQLLEEAGFDVRRVASGEEALSCLDDGLPDLVVSDYHLPGMNGGQMARQFRMNAHTRSIPILMLTEDVAPGLEREGLESGADAYISKSAHPDLLVLRIRALLREGSDFLQAEEAGRFRRARIVIVTSPRSDDSDEEPLADNASWERDASGASLGELLWRDGHTVTTVTASSELVNGGWLGGEEGPDCLVLDLTSRMLDGVNFCRRLDARRQDVLEAGGTSFRILGIVDANRFRRHSAADLFDAGLDDLVPSDIAPDVLALRIRVLVRRKLAQDEIRQQEIKRQVREVALQTAQSEARAIAAKAAMAEALAHANSELADANARLIETQAKLVQTAKMASLGELVAGIAHEINNPLAFTLAHEETIARALQRLIDSEGPLQSSQLALLEKCSNRIGAMRLGLQRIQNLVLSLRRFSRLDESAFQDTDVVEAIDTALALLAHKFGREIMVERHLNAPRMLVCQPALLHQVVMNIVSNAADAIRSRAETEGFEPGTPSGKIVIETTLRQSGNEAFYVISVADDGPGVPPALRARVFEPFFTTKPVGMGTGLGLAIAYGVIEAHGGTIDIDDANLSGGRGVGACFTLSVPVRLTPTGPVTIGRSA